MREQIVVREAAASDGPGLTALERDTPLVLGDTSITVDRGDDYFAAQRLMEQVFVVVAELDGKLIGALSGASRPGVIGGVEYRLGYGSHARILPALQGQGIEKLLMDHLGGLRVRHSVHLHSPSLYVSRDNAVGQRARRDWANRWSFPALRLLLPVESLAGSNVGRPTSPADAADGAEILNTYHAGEEMYVPYTRDSLMRRLQRAPDLYGWQRVRRTEHAVVGIWPAGEKIIHTLTTGDDQRESRRALVLDYGCRDGADDELEALLRGWAGILDNAGLTEISVFTSEGSRSHAFLTKLAADTETLDFWTPGVPEPPDAREHGLYVDQIYV